MTVRHIPVESAPRSPHTPRHLERLFGAPHAPFAPIHFLGAFGANWRIWRKHPNVNPR